jgi:glycosyltransferase involved in cell wall biosynthesis
MKIAVVTRMLRKEKLEGFGVFTHEILSRMVKAHPEHEFLFLFDRKFDDTFIYADNVKPFILFPRASHPKLLVFWYQFLLRRFLKKHKPDLLVSPDGGIPLKTDVKTLSVIHDLNFEHYPEDLPPKIRDYYQFYYRRISELATRLVTVSEYSKNDLVKIYGAEQNKIDVVHNGVGAKFSVMSESAKAEIMNKYSASKPYFLFVGSIHRRKNLPNMMKAFTEFRKSTSSEIKFIIAGAKRWWNEEMEDAYMNSEFRNDIIFTGRIDNSELPALTGAAFALLFVSRFEGFGIPIIEAMKCGVPVITATNSSMPEVAGDAALLVDADSVSSIASAMKRIAEDDPLRKQLSLKGIKRAEKFSWNESAAMFWKSIEKTVSQ